MTVVNLPARGLMARDRESPTPIRHRACCKGAGQLYHHRRTFLGQGEGYELVYGLIGSSTAGLSVFGGMALNPSFARSSREWVRLQAQSPRFRHCPLILPPQVSTPVTPMTWGLRRSDERSRPVTSSPAGPTGLGLSVGQSRADPSLGYLKTGNAMPLPPLLVSG